MYTTDMYEGLMAETVEMSGANGDEINAYFARPLGEVHFLRWCWHIICRAGINGIVKTTLKFAHHGYVTISPNLYFRSGHGTPEDIAAKVRAEGGIPDDQVCW